MMKTREHKTKSALLEVIHTLWAAVAARLAFTKAPRCEMDKICNICDDFTFHTIVRKDAREKPQFTEINYIIFLLLRPALRKKKSHLGKRRKTFTKGTAQ